METRRRIAWTRGAASLPAAAGLAALLAFAPAAPAQEWIATRSGSAAFDGFGTALDVVPDLDGDGVAELLIGAPYVTTTTSDEGAAYLLSGASGALLQQWSGSGRDDQLGLAVATLGDVDRDGVADVLLGMPNYSGSAVPGSVFLRSGATGDLLRTQVGSVNGQAYGAEVVALADRDGDGVAEYAVGAPGNASYYVYDGATGTELHHFTSQQADCGLGWVIEPFPDLDGDGIEELLVGSPFWRNAGGVVTGRLQIRSGTTGGVLRSHLGENSSHFRSDFFGMTAVALGDLDGDAIADYAVGAWAHGDCQQGCAYVYSGATGDEVRRIEGADCGESCGIALARGGDFDGDGAGDLLLGVPQFGGDLRGRVRLLSGADGRELSFAKGAAGECYGTTIANVADLDGDGILDLLAAAIGPVDSYVGSVVRHALAPPTITLLTPDRANYRATTSATLTGAAFRAEAGFELELDGAVVDGLSLPSTTQCSFELPAGAAGPALLVARNAFGTAQVRFDRTPSTSVSGDLAPGGSGVWTTLLDPADGLILLYGVPPRAAIPLPPYDGVLAISPYEIAWVEPSVASDRFELAFGLEDDPSLSGLELLAQALAGPKLGGRKRDGSFTNCVELTLR